MLEIESRKTSGNLFSLAQIMHLLRVEFSRAQRYKYSLTCAIFAVDRLYELRDRFGYEAKEKVLVALVDILNEDTRSCDFLGRLADDRLLLIVPHTDPEGVQAMVDRVIEKGRNLRLDGEGQPIMVTLSAGSASMRPGSLFFDSLLTQAQRSISEAFDSGGDRHITA